MKSMTGYAARDSEGRRWELRGVNGRGLDLRLRIPDSLSNLEQIARETLGKVVKRGNVTLSLRLGGDGVARGMPRLDPAALDHALADLAQVQTAAQQAGVAVQAPSSAELLSLRGIWEARDELAAPDPGEIKAELDTLVAEFDAARRREGAALAAILTAQVDEIAALVKAAEALLPERAAASAESFRAALARLTEASVEDARVVQEVAVLAVKGDVAEELDRLQAHIEAARGLIAFDGPVGRKLDFLTQEFNREANTLCAKAGHAGLTAIGLELKTVVDRLREQVQNVE